MSDSFPSVHKAAETPHKAAETACSSTSVAQLTSVEDGNQPDLLLRVCGSSNDGKLLRLRSAKCIIGSGPQCTLRLHNPRFQPVHCLILRGPNATVVRCWGRETLLNGRPFGDAPLATGDRLRVGPIELEVVELGRPVAAPAVDCKWQWDTGPTLDEAGAAACPRQETLAVHHQETLAEDQASLSHTSACQDSAKQIASSLHRQPFSGTAEKLPEPADDLLRRREAALRLARQRNRRLIRRLRQLKAQLAEMADDRPADCAEMDRLQQHTGSSAGAQRHDTSSDYSGERYAGVSGLGKYAGGEMATETTSDEQTGLALDDGPASPRQSALSKNQPTVQPKASAPVDLAEVFRRIGVAGQLLEVAEEEIGDSSSEADTPSSSAAGQPADTLVGTSTRPDQSHTDGDDAIDSYMQELLQRLRGSPSESKIGEQREGYRRAGSAADSTAAQASDSPQPPATANRQGVGPPNAELQPHDALGEATARTLPPEKLTGLSAMRELANISAQVALSQHARRTLNRLRRFKLLASLISGGCGLGLLWLWANYRVPIATLAIGLMSLAVAAMWAIQYAVLTGRFVWHHFRQPSSPEQASRSPTGSTPESPQSPSAPPAQTP